MVKRTSRATKRPNCSSARSLPCTMLTKSFSEALGVEDAPAFGFPGRPAALVHRGDETELLRQRGSRVQPDVQRGVVRAENREPER